MGCDRLEHDATRSIRHRNTGAASSDPSCKLCRHDQEDAVHLCPRLESTRLEALADALLISGSVLSSQQKFLSRKPGYSQKRGSTAVTAMEVRLFPRLQLG